MTPESFNDRPQIHVLMALPGLMNPSIPRAMSVISLLDVPRWQSFGWTFVGIDPQDEIAWQAWREVHPEAV